MVWLKFKWKFVLFLLISLNIVTESLPIKNVFSTTTITEELSVPNLPTYIEGTKSNHVHTVAESNKTNEIASDVKIIEEDSISDDMTKNIRPGKEVQVYAIQITRNGDDFHGIASITVRINEDREEPLRFHCEDLDIESVRVGIFTDANAAPHDFLLDDGVLEIEPEINSAIYVVIIEYTAPLRHDGRGLYISEFADVNYIAMNLHPVNARRVFPCVDEPTEPHPSISFTFNDVGFNSMVSNSMLEDNSQTAFRALPGPVHLWGMVAHNLNNINIPIANVLLYARPGLSNQDAQASVAINFFFTNLNEWTGKDYFEIILNQDGRMHIFALPDSTRDWYALSTVCIWEPYILMETTHSVRQRTLALTNIAESMARQWFGYVIFPENWRHQWVITGLSKYAGFEMMRLFQNDPIGNDVTLIDVNTIFICDIFQESLLRDGYVTAQPLVAEEDLFDENAIRDAIGGLINYKAVAIMRMLRLVLGDESQDFIKKAASALLDWNTLQSVNSLKFIDGINSNWLFDGNGIVEDIAEFLEPYIESPGYPLLNVGLRQGGLLLTLEHFSFSTRPTVNFEIPITYTTNSNGDFDNIHPVMVIDGTTTINLALGEEDWVIFNLQGQGYYRVNYDGDLWERLIETLEDPERREEIHPINRGTLVDDALNLARASIIDYETAFRVVLAMEHETEYAAWKAFVRNMNFLRKHLVAMVTEDEELDPDIYLRMVRRTIITFEEEIGFHPDPQILEPAMVSLVRGLVMDHACRANYAPCIAAAVDWFYNGDEVNPNIPRDLRPAVYCTMVREGGEEVIEMLEEQMENEPSLYERLVILESLACSQDEDFINDYLRRTIAQDTPYSVEERSRIFKAVAEASYSNANAALAFLAGNTPEVRNMYGGADRLEEVIFALADNIASPDQFEQFMIWINSINSFLDDSIDAAERAREQVREDMLWSDTHLEAVYEWIDENDAPTIIVSSFLIFVSLCIALFNH